MTGSCLLQIVVGEFEEGQSAWKPLYHDIVEYLMKKEIQNVIVVRTDEGIGERNDYRSVLLEEDIPFNNLPLVIEAVDNSSKITSVIKELKKMVRHGEIVTMNVIKVQEGGINMMEDSHLMLKIYVKEDSHPFRTANYDKILKLFQQHELIWSTITKAIEGFGPDHIIHKQSLFSFSTHVPVIIECVGKADEISSLICKIKEVVGTEGVIVALPVNVVEDE